jgi:hypothetical protein
MSVNDWVGIVVGLSTIYFSWQQNRIFQRQNEIFAAQTGKPMPAGRSGRARLGRYWPMLAMALLALLTWSAVGLYYYTRNQSGILEFDDARRAADLSGGYGQIAGSSCFMTVNSSLLLAMQDKYKLAIGCFISDGTTDILDAPEVQVSALYDIKDGDVTCRTNYSEAFQKYYGLKHSNGIMIAIFAVPNGVQSSSFTTLRQARAFGVKILEIRVAVRAAPSP